MPKSRRLSRRLAGGELCPDPRHINIPPPYIEVIEDFVPLVMWALGEPTGQPCIDYTYAGHDLVPTGNPAKTSGLVQDQDSAGKLFTGANYLTAAGEATLRYDGGFALSFWVSSTDKANWYSIAQKCNAALTEGWGLYQTPGAEPRGAGVANLYVNGNAGVIDIVGTTDLSVGVHNVVVVFRPGYAAIYVDGQLEGHEDCASVSIVPADGHDFILGDPVTGGYKGTLDSMCLYGTGLTADNVLEIYEAGTLIPPPLPAPPGYHAYMVRLGPEAYWTGDEHTSWQETITSLDNAMGPTLDVAISGAQVRQHPHFFAGTPGWELTVGGTQAVDYQGAHSNEWAVTMWLNTQSVGVKVYFSDLKPDATKGFLVRSDANGKTCVDVWGDGGTETFTSPLAIPNPAFLAAAYGPGVGGNYVSIWHNGVLVLYQKTTAVGNFYPNDNGTMWIGSHNGTSYAVGLIDEVSVSGGQLTDDAVADLWSRRSIP